MSLTNRTPLASAYFRFLQLARAVEALPDGALMDANESALLEAVVLRWHEGHPMTVREAINLATLGSPATLHKRITRLRNKALLDTLPLGTYTPSTLTTRSALEAELQQIQKQGYAVDAEEFVEGLVCVAVPVIQGQGRAVRTALALQAPAARMGLGQVVQQVPHLIQAAQAMARGMV